MALAHKLITAWFVLTTPVILWDVGYCLLRPRSMEGGDLHWIWTPYALYAKIDYVYGTRALENNEGFTSAQALLNVFETVLNVIYVYLWNVVGSPSAPVVGFASAAMTLNKTLLYWAQEYYCGFCSIGHNSWQDLLLLWVLPNGLWILFPSLIVWKLGGDMAVSLRANAAKKDVKKKE